MTHHEQSEVPKNMNGNQENVIGTNGDDTTERVMCTQTKDMAANTTPVPDLDHHLDHVLDH